jgi:hypothetical protein
VSINKVPIGFGSTAQLYLSHCLLIAGSGSAKGIYLLLRTMVTSFNGSDHQKSIILISLDTAKDHNFS